MGANPAATLCGNAAGQSSTTQEYSIFIRRWRRHTQIERDRDRADLRLWISLRGCKTKTENRPQIKANWHTDSSGKT